ncbi:hypothetical protein HYPSUDRAFT_48176 [Hypholoma sublateritium FD-334 SS-4]|uniref:Uncharacterized protein n=1 Tax=Hypholoma sublateritium (strain FD-334 SS-4) TaxID=945553 RepID=A0A0D2NG74_HYPSF|nr:hypothetical protein HYPSUDRAFT_48176 [Hypholoma sublateritium FD-334 SS-4]
MYFHVWEDQYFNEDVFRNSFHAHPFIRQYICNFWKEVDGEFTQKQIHPAAIAEITATLEIIDDALHRMLEEDHGQSLDCLFYPAALYTQMCRRWLSDHADLDAAVELLLPIFARCRDHIASRGSDIERIFGGGEYDESQGIVLFSKEWWDVLFLFSSNHSSTSRIPRPQVDADDPPNHIVFGAATEVAVAISGNTVELVETHSSIHFPLAPSQRDDAPNWTMDSIV